MILTYPNMSERCYCCMMGNLAAGIQIRVFPGGLTLNLPSSHRFVLGTPNSIRSLLFVPRFSFDFPRFPSAALLQFSHGKAEKREGSD